MKYMRLLSSFMVLFFVYSAKGMQGKIHFKEQLSEIEELIVLHKMKHANHKMFDTNNMLHTQEESKTISITTVIREDQTDDLATLVMNTINEQEKQIGYIPEQISKKKDGVWDITRHNNYIGNYSRYWHKKDDTGNYIELVSTFTYLPAVAEVLNNYSS